MEKEASLNDQNNMPWKYSQKDETKMVIDLTIILLPQP